MLFISIISIIVAVALPAVKISPLLFTRMISIILVFSGIISFNSLYAQSIGSGLGIYSGLFQVTFLCQSIETFIYFMAALITGNLNLKKINIGREKITEEAVTTSILNHEYNGLSMQKKVKYAIIPVFTITFISFLPVADFVYYLSPSLYQFLGLYGIVIVKYFLLVWCIIWLLVI